MSNCQDRPTLFPEALWKALMNLPALRYMKAPVFKESDLYEEYPTGNEWGTFAYVHESNTFFVYHPRGRYARRWRPISADSVSSFFEIDSEFLKEGDILVYDSNKKKFVVKSGNVWNKLLGDLKDTFSQVTKFLNQTDEIPTDESYSGVYFVHKDEETTAFRALYIVLGKKAIKIFNSSDYRTKEEVDTELSKKANQTQVDDIAASVDVLAVTKAEKSVVDALMNGIIKQPAVDTYNTTSGGKTSLLSKYPNPQVGWDVLVREDETKGGISNRYNWNGTQWVDMEMGIYDENVMLSGGTTKTGQQLENNNVNSAHNVIGDFLDLSGVAFTANKELNISGDMIDANNYSVSNPIPVSEMEYLTMYVGGGYTSMRNQYPIHGYVNESDSVSIWNPTFTNLKSSIKFFGQIPTEVKYVRLVIHSTWIGVSSVALAKKNATSQSALDHISGRFYLDFNLFTIDTSLNFSGAVTFRSGYSTLGFKNVKGKNRIIIKGDYVVSSTNASRILHGYISNTDTVSIFQSDIIYAGGKMDIDVIIPSQVQYIRFYIPTDKLRDTYVAITSEIPQSADKAVQFSSRSQPKEVVDWSGNFTRNVLTPTDKDRSFPGIVARGNQVMLTYMNRTDHLANDWIGQRSIRFSTDGGVTFGEEYTLPTGINIGGAYRYIKGNNQNKITAFEGFLDRSGASGYYERSRPVSGTFDDVFNSNGQSGMTQSDYISIPSRQYPSQPIMSSKVIEHNGVLYACGYDNQQFFSPNNSRSFLLKSSDNGINWELVSMIPVDGTGECTIAFKGERLIMVSRIRFGNNLTTENNKLSYSNDYGLTWITQEMTGYNVHNPQLFVFADTVFLMGRLILPDKYCLAVLTLDDLLNVKDLYSLDNSSKVPSFHQDFMFTSDYMRIFTHKYIDETQTKSYVYTIDLPLSSLLFMSGKSISPISLKHIPLSQSDFNSLAVKDSNTIYYVY